MRVRQIREKLGLSQIDLAEKVGKKQSHVSDFERGASNPTVATLQLYADALGVEISDLFQDLTEYETEMLRIFRTMTTEEQKGFITALGLAETAKGIRERS